MNPSDCLRVGVPRDHGRFTERRFPGWVGFDTCHAFDVWPALDVLSLLGYSFTKLNTRTDGSSRSRPGTRKGAAGLGRPRVGVGVLA